MSRFSRRESCSFSFPILLCGAALLWPKLIHAEEDKESKHGSQRLKTELTAVPIAGGDTDAGFGGGYMASLARVGKNYEPYFLRVQSASIFLVKADDDVALTYVDSYVAFELPHLIRDRLGATLRLSYTRETQLNYFGIGNAVPDPPDLESSRSRYHYGRIHPTLQVKFDHRVGSAFHLLWGAAFTKNSFIIPADSQLRDDAEGGTPAVKRHLGQVLPHDVASFSYGVSWDDRDDLVNTRRGQFYSARIDLSPGGDARFPYRWARTNVALRGYLPLVRRRLTLAGRLLADFLIGNPPFYELPRYDETSAIGGGTGVRGIPAQRYYGRIKLIGNIELRSELFDFHLFDKDNVFGLVAFFDSGRVFTDYHANSELDGSGLGLKYGTGLGLRLAAGKSFVLRFDAAWSDRAAPSSFYLGSGHIF